MHRYSKEGFNSEHSLYKYLKLFVISNGTDSRYLANTTQRNKNSFDFTMHWAKADNSLIRDPKDFTATFFQKHALLNVLLHYSVFDVSNTLLVRRYIAASLKRKFASDSGIPVLYRRGWPGSAGQRPTTDGY